MSDRNMTAPKLTSQCEPDDEDDEEEVEEEPEQRRERLLNMEEDDAYERWRDDRLGL